MTAMMDDGERDLFLRLGWFAPESVVLDVACRPVSLGSMEAMRLMGLGLLTEEDEGWPADSLTATREIAVYLWLHDRETPVEAVERALWDGSWRRIGAAIEEANAAVISEFAVMRLRLRRLIGAAGIEIRPRPKSHHDDTPWNVVGPGALAHRVTVLGRATGWSRREILWRLPLYQAEQIYHAEMRWQGMWTVRAGAGEVRAEVFEDFAIGALFETDPMSDDDGGRDHDRPGEVQ